MQIKTLRNALIGTTGTAIAMLAGVGAWTLFWGSVGVPHVEIPIASQQFSSGETANASKSIKSFDGLWNLTLQEPRTAKPIPKAAPSVVQQASSGFGIKLVGTVIETSQSLGLFRDDRGAFDLKGVGQALELVPAGAQVANIEPGIATLRYEGKELKLPMDAGTSSAPGFAGMRGAPVMQPQESDQNMMQSEPVGMMMPMNPTDAAPEGEEDIFAPLPANMDPTRPMPASDAPMEAQP